MVRTLELLVLVAGTWVIAVATVLAVQYVREGRNKVDPELLPKDEPMAPPRSLPRLAEVGRSPFAPKQTPLPLRWRAPKQKRSTTWAALVEIAVVPKPPAPPPRPLPSPPKPPVPPWEPAASSDLLP